MESVPVCKRIINTCYCRNYNSNTKSNQTGSKKKPEYFFRFTHIISSIKGQPECFPAVLKLFFISFLPSLLLLLQQQHPTLFLRQYSSGFQRLINQTNHLDNHQILMRKYSFFCIWFTCKTDYVFRWKICKIIKWKTDIRSN